RGPATSASARFVHQAVIPIWLPVVLGLLLLLVLLVNRMSPPGGAATTPTTVPTALPTALPTEAPSPTTEPGAPVVSLFTVAPQVVAPGQPVLVSWNVQGADRVVIEQFGDVPPQGQREHRPEVTTDYRLIAEGGGKTTTRIERVNVV